MYAPSTSSRKAGRRPAPNQPDRRPALRRFIALLRPSDRLSLAWMAVTGIPAAWVLPGHLEQLGMPWWEIPLFHAAGFAALAVFLPLTARSRHGIIVFVRSWYPLLLVPLLFAELYYLIPAVNPYDVDPFLQRVEVAVFGVVPAVWMQRLYWPPLTDALFIAYGMFYFLLLVPAVPLYRAGYLRKFDRFAFLVLLNCYMAFAIYFAMPCVGPGVALASQFSRKLQGVFAAQFIYKTIHSLEGIHRDCFPSVHTQLSVVVLGYMYMHGWPSFRWILPITAAIVFATIYCRYHYTPDIAAGMLLGLLSLGYYRKLYGRAACLGGKHRRKHKRQTGIS
ncbi:MAG TPA: phosphatase PAP2 family protein [Planctomycetota bacterium]|nr:phosphatase PAP2 family protein [Planctomycetota bacterium]